MELSKREKNNFELVERISISPSWYNRVLVLPTYYFFQEIYLKILVSYDLEKRERCGVVAAQPWRKRDSLSQVSLSQFLKSPRFLDPNGINLYIF